MGDCRISIDVSANLRITTKRSVRSSDGDGHTSNNDLFTVSKKFSADTPIRDVLEEIRSHVSAVSLSAASIVPPNISIWDCTVHPSQDVTKFFEQFPDRSGPKSRTLQSSGWFPSGTLQVLELGAAPTITAPAEDYQYNLPSGKESGSSQQKVQLLAKGPDNSQTTSDSVPLPSEVLQSVTTRFDGDAAIEPSETLEHRQRRQVEKKEKERQRKELIDERLKRLEESSSSTSLQVRNILLKSRSVGENRISQQDRFYLQVGVLDDDVFTTGVAPAMEYRFFSRMDTIGKIIRSVGEMDSKRTVECLVKRTGQCYRRLPTTMRLYEASEKGFLESFGAVVVRIYETTSPEGQTLSVLDEMEVEKNRTEKARPSETIPTKIADVSAGTNSQTEEGKCDNLSTIDPTVVKRIEVALAASSGSKKQAKNKATSAKVRSMLIKGKAVGDKKRVPKMEQRFHIELIQISNDTTVSSFVFFARTDRIGRIVKDCCSNTETDVELLAKSDGGYKKLPLDMTFETSEAQGILNPFDLVFVIPKEG